MEGSPMTSRSISTSLYAIIDAEISPDPLLLADRALRAGCAMLQLRCKRLDDRAFIEMAAEIRALCARVKTPFVINDRADIARIVQADGLHLGQDDLCVTDARRVVGEMQIGVSTHDPTQAEQAERDGADLIAFGPVFDTTSKENPDPVVGLDRLHRVCGTAARPVVAIGGITVENAAATLQAGAAYVAVISALPSFLDSG
jgi:thiamine-phosphate pyrophosphorylase